jgi:hypothetical protein
MIKLSKFLAASSKSVERNGGEDDQAAADHLHEHRVEERADRDGSR